MLDVKQGRRVCGPCVAQSPDIVKDRSFCLRAVVNPVVTKSNPNVHEKATGRVEHRRQVGYDTLMDDESAGLETEPGRRVPRRICPSRHRLGGLRPNLDSE